MEDDVEDSPAGGPSAAKDAVHIVEATIAAHSIAQRVRLHFLCFITFLSFPPGETPVFLSLLYLIFGRKSSYFSKNFKGI